MRATKWPPSDDVIIAGSRVGPGNKELPVPPHPNASYHLQKGELDFFESPRPSAWKEAWPTQIVHKNYECTEQKRKWRAGIEASASECTTGDLSDFLHRWAQHFFITHHDIYKFAGVYMLYVPCGGQGGVAPSALTSHLSSSIAGCYSIHKWPTFLPICIYFVGKI